MGLVSGKIILLIIVIVLALGFAIGSNNGTVVFGKPSYECFGGRHWIPAGDKLTWLKMGSLQLKYQPYALDCDQDHQYSSQTYHVENGELVAN